MEASPTSDETVLQPAADISVKITRGHSCMLCQTRKVRCDRQKPCSNCIKSKAECVVATPAHARRRRKKLTESDLVLRLRRYEHLLKSHGIKVETDDIYPSEAQYPPGEARRDDINDIRRLNLNAPRHETHETGAWFFGKNRAHYVENTLWESMKDEIGDIDTSSEDEVEGANEMPAGELLLMGLASGSSILLELHPSVSHIFRLWQVYLENVNPLVKLFHAPTVQQMITDASGDLTSVSRPNEALLFSIYFLAALSLTPQQCVSYFGESQQCLLARYTRGIQLALVNAKLLRTTNLTTLQALLLYLIGGRRVYDPQTIHSLSGVAIRVALRLGIHTEAKASKLPPFDAEMRRRTWWQLVFLEGHSSKLAGAPFPAWIVKYDAKFPRNVNDSDLTPGMKELPASKTGITEMTFCGLRFETILVLRNAPPIEITNDDGTTRPCTITELLELKDQAIVKLQQLLEEKYLQYCDPSIPMQLTTLIMAKSVISTMKVMAHHPRNYPDRGASMPQKEKDMVFQQVLKELELHALAHEDKMLDGYTWHNHVYFQFDGFIFLVSELRVRTTGALVDEAWLHVEKVYRWRPEMISDTKNILYVAIGGLVLKAWRERELALNSVHSHPPRFITQLRGQKSASRTSKSNTQSPAQSEVQIPPSQIPPTMDYQTNLPLMAYQMPVYSLAPWDGPSIDYSMGDNFDPPLSSAPTTDWDNWQALMSGEISGNTTEPANKNWQI